MKCVEAETSILLQDSGELGANQVRELEAHLAQCEACRQFKQMLLSTAKAFGAVHEPPAKAVYNVLRTARIHAPARRHLPVFAWKPALAMAAAAVMALGLYLGNHAPNRIGIEIDMADAQLLEPEDQVVSIMYEGLSEDDLVFNFLMTYEGGLEG